ncbi:FAD/NAD(P)-binding protein [Streptomyces sp. Da 82-17]|uniref:FAD/NAD(P)-binding protein n=1 Tax=Streptomyces sp. Da 82-17 TaxID=3377116 RepID=UPI0038D46921
MSTAQTPAQTPAQPPARTRRPAVLGVVGAGPRALGLLERIAANAPELLAPTRELHIHLVDPHPPGAGRVWRHEQSPLLRMNSMAEDVTVFTDSTSTLEGPVRPGPTLAAWAADPHRHPPVRPVQDPAVRAELAALRPTDFPTRRAQGAYLDWAFHRALTELPPHIEVFVHRTTATRLTGPADGPQLLHLADRPEPVEADLVVLAQGHLSSSPDPAQSALAAFADRHQLRYIPPEFSADADLSAIPPGEPVLLRGFGLAAVDLTVLLTEGRGGTYATGPGGRLTYRPSGREPILYVGSRRGVPYRAKPGYRLRAARAPLPRHFGPDRIAALAEESRRHGRLLDLRRDVWPLIAKEVGFGHYHELFHAHPERTTVPWPRFLAAYDRLGWYDEELAKLVAEAVPDPEDRLDLDALDRPLAGHTAPDHATFQDELRRRIEADIARRENPAHSADLGAFHALLSVYGQLPALAATGRLTPDSVARQLDGWWTGFFSYYASGPPAFRLRELLALSRAGVVRFVGADLDVAADEAEGVFRARSSTVPGHAVTATTLIEAYLPRPTVSRTADPLLAALRRDGQAVEERRRGGGQDLTTGRLSASPADGHLLTPSDGDGTQAPHPRRIALGAPTTSRAIAAFARPHTDAPVFRQNDATARAVLRFASRGST